MSHRLLALLAQLSLLISAHAASAAVITSYSSRASWEAAVGTFATEDFETTPLGLLPHGFDSGVVSIQTGLLEITIGGNNHGGFGIQEPGLVNGTREFRGDLHGPRSAASIGPLSNTIELSYSASAFAASFTPLSDVIGPDDFPMNVHILGEVFPVARGTTFFGVMSDTAFTTIELTADPVNGVNFFYSMDDVSFSPIPEPNAGLLMMTGLLGLAYRQRRCGRPVDGVGL